MITTISRLRSNHCLTRKHLHKIGITDNPECECGEIEDIVHLLFTYPNRLQSSTTLYFNLSKNLSNPLSIENIVTNPTAHTSRLIYYYLLEHNFKI